MRLCLLAGTLGANHERVCTSFHAPFTCIIKSPQQDGTPSLVCHGVGSAAPSAWHRPLLSSVPAPHE
jgi:hypothetical protein